MTTLLGVIVHPNFNTAQIMYLIAIVLAALATLGGLLHRPEPWWPFLWAPIMLFVALGLLWSF
jgi:hypothetical protein